MVSEVIMKCEHCGKAVKVTWEDIKYLVEKDVKEISCSDCFRKK